MKSDVLTLIQGTTRVRNQRGARHDGSMSRDQPQARTSDKPYTIEELSEIAHEVLTDKYLEVSKVRPFFWFLIETYADRFQGYPFDVFKLLFSYLEMNDYPAEETEQIISKLEQEYTKKYGKPVKPVVPVAEVNDSLDDDIRELRDSLAYAALVGENT